MKNPCKDCITLSICKGIIQRYVKDPINWAFPYAAAYDELMERCSLIIPNLKNVSWSKLNYLVKKMIEEEVENI